MSPACARMFAYSLQRLCNVRAEPALGVQLQITLARSLVIRFSGLRTNSNIFVLALGQFLYIKFINLRARSKTSRNETAQESSPQE